MDARERLRRYLEQRREMGESELILDGLPVEDVMAMLTTRPGAPRARAPRGEPQGEVVVDAPAPERTHTSVSDPVPTPAPTPAPTPPADLVPPVEPTRRFEADSSTDWRATLRRAGAMRPDARPDASDAPVPAPRVDVASDEIPAWLAALGLPLGVSSGLAGTASLEPAIAQLPTLDAIAEMVRVCARCDLSRTAINPVPGEGNPNAEVVCVGEAPGQSEDEQGRPFVGAAGSLLNKILAAIQLQRDEVFICNVLKHRPPGNRDPLPAEVKACEPYLRRQLELIKPRVILALGRFAAQSLLQTTTPIGKLRGQIHRYHGIPLIVTYHPAALLRNEAWKRPTWEDVKLARRILDASRAASAP